MVKTKCFLLTILFILPCLAAGETTIICEYDSYSNIEGNHKAEEEFILNFIIDNEKRLAYMTGTNGRTEVTYLPAKYGLTLLENTSFGNIMTTTIDKNNNSVHSRNTIINGILAPSQFYGKCKIKQ